jgi:hypothetical protein
LQAALRIAPTFFFHGACHHAHHFKTLVSFSEHLIFLDLYTWCLEGRIVAAVPVEVAKHRNGNDQSADDQ